MRSALVVFIIIVVLFEIFILFPKSDSEPDTSQAQKTELAPKEPIDKNTVQQKMQGIHLVESQRGTRDWELFSKNAQSYHGQNDWDLEEVEIHFYNEDKKDMTVRGERGKIDSESKDMRIEGKVLVETANGYVFSAPYIEYKSDKRLIVCSGLVQVRGPHEQGIRTLFLKGTGMRIPVTERKMYLEQNISGEKQFPDNKVLKFTSTQAELSAASLTALLKGNVVIHYDPMVMKSENAMFTYSEKTKLFESLDLQGKVELKENDRRALSENLRVDFSTKQFTFSGKPRLYQGEDELVGDKIIFLDNGKRVKVEKVKAKGTLE